MKFALVLCTLAGIAFAAPINNLFNDLHDFMKVVPMQQIREVAFKHLDNDAEFKAALKYLQSKEWKSLVKVLMTKPSAKEIRLIIKEGGLETEIMEHLACSFLDSLEIDVADGEKRSFKKFLAEINALIPYEKIMDMLIEKLETSPAFKRLFDAVSGERMHGLVDKILMSREFEKVATELIAMDIPVVQIIETVYEVFGWKPFDFSQNDLK